MLVSQKVVSMSVTECTVTGNIGNAVLFAPRVEATNLYLIAG